jgi:hypothetical protein
MSSECAQIRFLPAITSRTEAARADFPGTVSAQTDECPAAPRPVGLPADLGKHRTLVF